MWFLQKQLRQPVHSGTLTYYIRKQYALVACGVGRWTWVGVLMHGRTFQVHVPRSTGPELRRRGFGWEQSGVSKNARGQHKSGPGGNCRLLKPVITPSARWGIMNFTDGAVSEDTNVLYMQNRGEKWRECKGSGWGKGKVWGGWAGEWGWLSVNLGAQRHRIESDPSLCLSTSLREVISCNPRSTFLPIGTQGGESKRVNSRCSLTAAHTNACARPPTAISQTHQTAPQAPVRLQWVELLHHSRQRGKQKDQGLMAASKEDFNPFRPTLRPSPAAFLCVLGAHVFDSIIKAHFNGVGLSLGTICSIICFTIESDVLVYG